MIKRQCLHVNIKEIHDDHEDENFDDKKNDRVNHLSYEPLIQRTNKQLVATVVANDFLCSR